MENGQQIWLHSQHKPRTTLTTEFETHLPVLVKAVVSLVESVHEVQRVIGQPLESFRDTVCTTGRAKKTHQINRFSLYLIENFTQVSVLLV